MNTKRLIAAAALLAALCAGCGSTEPATVKAEREAPSSCRTEQTCTPEDPAWWETPGDDDHCPDYVGSPSCPITPCVTTTIRPEGHLCTD